MNELLKTFAYHKPSPQGLERIRRLREAYSNLLRELNDVCPIGSSELSVAKTELETSAMWAVKAVVVNDPNSEVQT